MADTGTHMSAKKKNPVKLKYTTFIANDNSKEKRNGNCEEEISLQEAFKKYRKAKKKQLKHARRLRRRNELRKADPKVMAALRRKFIQQAKKYFGYPYAKKYWSPDSPEYRSNLFLDCCGLVRQVMRDLADDFGFVIGPWNQAYMYDTLPISVKEEEMRPGDLVFVSATYYNPKSKKQPHNMTHVEIWLGDGPKTIGARWNNGKVQVFDSYRFTAKSYYDETYHFKSIDTWLKGICQSHCSQHGWKRRKFNPRKKSVFSIDQQQSSSQNDQQDQTAGDDEDDITNFIIQGNSFTADSDTSVQKSKNKTKNESEKQDQISASSSKEVSPVMGASTPDVLDVEDDQIKDTDITEAEDNLSDVDNGDVESSSDDLDDTDMDFIDAGDADIDDECHEEIKDTQTRSSKADSDEIPQTDIRDSLSRSGRLVDFDKRGIYLGGLYNGEANSPVSVADFDKTAARSTPNLNETVDPCHICTEKASEQENLNNDIDNILIKSDKSIHGTIENIENLTLIEQKPSPTNQPQLTMKDGRFENGLSDKTMSDGIDSSDTNQNALPNNKVEGKPCTIPATATRLSPIYSTSGSSCESSSLEKKMAQSTGSDECIADSQSTSSLQTDYKDPESTEISEETSGSESGKKKGGKKSPGYHTRPTKLPACSLPTNMTPSFYVGGGNGVSLVEGPLTGLGWKRITDKFDERFKLKWVECKSKINYGAFREGEQMVNHIPNSHLLTNKLGLLNSLKEYERVTLSTKGRLPRLKMSDFHPETYKLDEKSDRDLFLEVYKDGEIWICKPVGMNQGKGIFLIRTKEAILQLLEEREQRKQQQQKPGKPLMNRIVQRYIMNPLLLDGRKFDVRAYMLIASTVPFLVLYHKGYVRLSCLKYDTDDQNLGVHLTNQFVQKKDPLYKDLKEETAWSMDRFNDYINNEVRPHSHVEFEEDWVFNSFTKQMQKIMIHCFNSVKHKLQARLGYFDLFGLDFMVDTDMKTWLIEINVNPCLSRKCSAQKEVIPGLIADYLYISIESFEKSKKNLPLMPLQSLKNFTILYCGTRPNTIVPRQSRSVSPVKENTAEKPKHVPTGALRRTGSPTRAQHRSSIHSTPLYTVHDRKHESGNRESMPNAQTSSAKSNVASANNKKSKTAVSSDKTEESKSENKSKPEEQSIDIPNKEGVGEQPVTDVEKDVKTEPKSHVVVVDTLTKTNDSLTEANNMLGKLSQSLNQVGLAESILEEVRLKMTHADQTVTQGERPFSPNSEKLKSAKQKRENLERGN